jgi:serine/threonine protein phosphatase PrpC
MNSEGEPVRAWGTTDVGCVREGNEDAFLVDARAGFAVVADGIGGLQSGEVASRLAVATIGEFLTRRLQYPDVDQPGKLLQIIHEALRVANEAVLAEAKIRDEELGSTVVLVVVRGNRAVVANSGDSRAYLFKAGHLRLLSQDHTTDALATRFFGATAAAESGSALTQCLGKRPDFFLPYALELKLAAGDTFLLCSDGLWKEISESALLVHLGGARANLTNSGLALLDEAKKAGAHDNVTVVLMTMDRVPAARRLELSASTWIGSAAIAVSVLVLAMWIVVTTWWVHRTGTHAAQPMTRSRAPAIAANGLDPSAASVKPPNPNSSAAAQVLPQDAEDGVPTIYKIDGKVVSKEEYFARHNLQQMPPARPEPN